MYKLSYRFKTWRQYKTFGHYDTLAEAATWLSHVVNDYTESKDICRAPAARFAMTDKGRIRDKGGSK